MKVILSVLFLAAVVYADADLKCPEAQADNWSIELLLPHSSCNKFYKCTYGEPVEQQCPDDLWFNLDTWQCDWANNVDCRERDVPGAESSEEAVPKPETVEPLPEPEVETEPEVESQPEPEPETEEEAVEEEQSVEDNEETVEKSSKETEEEKEETAEETEEECEEEPEQSEEAQPEIEFQKNGCPVDPHLYWLLPNEEDCNQFYYCVWGDKVPRQCPPTLHFNRELQVCDWPVDAGCSISADKHYASRLAYRNML